MVQKEPILSIGIIFRNEIRCLERCLRSLDKLRQTIPCELVMADTGSNDGSREIAESYADILFDFPWIDDFAAARNAVMDHCSGKWYLSIDADEWLDENISPLVKFLEKGNYPELIGGITIRNYVSATDSTSYSEFVGIRLAYIPSGVRYVGTIHERLESPDGLQLYVRPMSDIVLHHDGYIMLNDGSEAGREKLRRNMRMLEKELDADPDNLQLLTQCIESSGLNYDVQLPYIRRGVKLVLDKGNGWEKRGANLLRYAVHAAHKKGLPEFQEWITLAEELFPTSIYTTIDIQYDAAEHAWCDMDCPEIIRRGKRYLKGVAEYRSGHYDVNEALQSPLNDARFQDESTLRICIARAQVYEGCPEDALETLSVLDYDTMDEGQTGALLETLLRLQTLSQVDVEPLLLGFWSKLNEPKPSQAAADSRRTAFIVGASLQFALDLIKDETARMAGEWSLGGIGEIRAEEWNVLCKLRPCRHGYTLFKPLAGELELGAAAVLMDEEDLGTAARLLGSVERFDEFPIYALSRALLRGVVFPLPDHPLNIEEMDRLAVRLTQDQDALLAIIKDAVSEDFAGSWQTLAWVRGLVLAAVRRRDWKENGSLELVQAFVKVEKAFLPGYYTPEILREGNLCVLPPMHRFGWHCVQAFDSLEAGDAAGCARCLREGLSSCGEAKDVVEFLLASLPELQTPPPSPELLVMAEKVRMILNMYPADNPAVEALKASPAYQRVAYLIEEDSV